LEDGGQSRLTTLETELESLRAENRELREQMESVLLDLSNLQSAFEDLRRDLGG
jgi:predicted  nucleic acid-binding Zn-ribbon protein